MFLVILAYAAVVWVVYMILALSWQRFSRVPEDLFTLFAPLIGYFVLDAIRDRQGMYFIYAPVFVAAAVCLMMPLRGFFPRRRLAVGVIITVVGTLVAVLAWRFLPASRLFEGNEPLVW